MNNNGMLFGERRQKQRSSCFRPIEIEEKLNRHTGHLRNITAEGAFVQPNCRVRLKIGQELFLTIPYGLKKAEMTVKAKVVRVSRQGIGVCFISTN